MGPLRRHTVILSQGKDFTPFLQDGLSRAAAVGAGRGYLLFHRAGYGRRDRTLLHLCVQTGLRVSELIGLRCGDVVLGTGAHVRCRGKGRKDRSTPLRADTAAILGVWLDERADTADRPLFVSNRNGRLSRDAVERIVRKYAALAAERCPTLKGKHVTPHCLRHTAAMELLHNGVGCTVIALWLGHESVETTQIYLHADLQVKEKAMERTRPVDTPPGRYRPNNRSGSESA